MSLTVQDADGSAVVNIKGNFLSELIEGGIRNYHGFDCVFNRPFVKQGNSDYCVLAEITSLPSWYGQKGQTSVQHPVAKIIFATLGKRTTVERAGNFQCFLFKSV